LCNFQQSKVSCWLHMYFLWRHHLPPDKSENDQYSDSDSFTYCIDNLTYDCRHCFYNIWASHALELTINFHYPTLELFCFVFHLPNHLLTQNFVYPTLFSSVPPPAININDRSLRAWTNDINKYFGIFWNLPFGNQGVVLNLLSANHNARFVLLRWYSSVKVSKEFTSNQINRNSNAFRCRNLNLVAFIWKK
jgi:hypothetical protein